MNSLVELKQAIQNHIAKCPLIPDLTSLSIGERSKLLAEHSITLDEWHQNFKRLLKRELDGLLQNEAKTLSQLLNLYDVRSERKFILVGEEGETKKP